MNNPELSQRARLWSHKASVNDALWEAAVRHFGNVSVSHCFLMKVDKGCPQHPEYIETLAQTAGGVWESTLKTDVSQHRCRVISRIAWRPWWNLSCDGDVWLHEQTTMNRAQNLFVDERLARIHSRSSHDDSCCYFADHKTLRLRPVLTYDMTWKSRVCIMDLRSAPAREFEAIRQHMKAMPPHMV